MQTAKLRNAILITAIFGCMASHAPAQSLSTKLEGLVRDAVSGLPVENARVELGAGEYVGLTDAAGRFSFAHLPLGEWRLTVSRVGYNPNRSLWVSIVEDVPQFVRLRLQPQPIVLPEQRVIGSRRDPNLFLQPEAVLTREEIKKSGFQDVAEALASLPGVIVNPGYSSTGAQQVTIRGETGKRLAVTLDGISLADGVRGEVDLSAVPISAIETIEVRRGGDWGDAAIGGAVDIHTRKTFPTDRGLSAGYGSFENWNMSLMTSGLLGSKLGYLATGEVAGRGSEYTYINEAGRDTTRRNTERRVQKAFVKLGGQLARRWDWGISGLFNENNRGAPGALHSSTPSAELRERRRILAANLTGKVGGVANLSLRMSISDFRTRYRDTLTFRAHSQFDETIYSANTSMVLGPIFHSLLTFSAGGEFQHRELEGINYLVPQRSFGRAARTANSVWLQSRLRSPRVVPVWLGDGQLVGGLRYDRDGQTPEYWAPRVGATWGWGRPRVVGLNANWGRSFRRPLLTSLFWKEDAFSRGNPDLEPEKAREWDAGVEITPPRTNLTAGMRFFDRSYDGFIEWEKRYGGSWSPINLPRATLIGREDVLAWTAFGNCLGFDFFHTLMWPINRAPDRNYDGKFLLFRPKHTYQMKVFAEYHGLHMRFDGRWVGRRYTRKQNTKSLPPYRWFDIAIRQTVNWKDRRAILSLKGENLTDEPVSLLEGYPLPSRTVRLGLELHF